MKPTLAKNPPALRAAAEARSKKQSAGRPSSSTTDVRRLQHELEVHQIELEMQNEELRAAQAIITQSLEQYTDLYDFAPVGYFTLTADGTICQLNLTGAELLGRERSRLVGTPFGALVLAGERKRFNDYLAKVFADELTRDLCLTLTPQSGPRLNVRLEARREATGQCCRLVVINITAQVWTVEALHDTQENLVSLISALPDNVIFKDGGGHWLVANPPAIEFFQLKDFPWIGKTDAELAREIPALKDLFAVLTRSDEVSWASGRLTQTTERVPGADGKFQEHEVHKVPIFKADGSRHALLAIGRDVTEKRRLETALQLSELMASESRDALLLVRRSDGRIFSANVAAADLYGYTREELLAKTFYDLRPDSDAALSAVQMAEAFAKGILFETVHVRQDGHAIPVEVSSHGTILEGEEFLVSAIRDISVRKVAEGKLLQLEQSMSVAANSIILVDVSGKIFWVNDTFTRLTGYSQEEALGNNPRVLKSGQHSPEFYRELWQTVLAGKVWKGEIINRRKDGSLYHQGTTITPVLNATGHVTHFIGVQEDITARKQAEAENIRLASIVTSSDDAIFGQNLDGTITSWNRGAEKIYGYPAAEMIGSSISRIIPVERQPEENLLLASIARGEVVENFETVRLTRAGQRIEVSVTASPIRDDVGRIVGVSKVVRNITERKQAEAVLREKTRLLSESQNIASLGSYVFDVVNNRWDSSEVLDRVFGIGPVYERSLAGWTALIHPDDRTMVSDYFTQEVLAQKRHFNKEYRVIRRNDQAERWVQGLGRLEFDARGNPIRMQGTIQDITTRKQAEAQLTESEERYRQIVDNAQDIIFILAPDSTFISVNEVVEWVSGRGAAYWIGKPFSPLVHPDDLPLASEKFQAIMKGESVEPCELRGHPSLPQAVSVEITLFARKDGQGKIIGAMGIGRDITERKQAEAALTEARDFHLQLLQNAPALIWRMGTNLKCNWFNATWLAFTGRPLEQEIGDGWMASVHPDDLNACLKGYLAHFKSRETFMLEYRLRRHDGVYRWIADHGQPFELPGGGFGGYIGYFLDIHDNKQAQDLLEQRVAERTKEIAALAEVIDNTTVPFALSGLAGQLLSFNRAYEELVGYSRAELMAENRDWIIDHTPLEWREMRAAKVQESLRTRQPVRYEKEYIRKNGSRVPVEVFMQPVFDTEDHFLHFRTFVTDITERKALATKLAADALEIEQLYHRAPCGYHSLNQRGEFVRINDTELAWLGYTRTELLGRNMAELLSPEHQEIFTKRFIDFTNIDHVVNFDVHLIRKDGTVLPVVMNTVAARDAAGNFIESRTTVFDNTERQKAAQSLELAWKMAHEASRAKSEFLANMSHELRTPLNAILGFTQLLRQDATLPETALDKLQTINKSGDNLLNILNDILDLAKIEAGRMVVQPVEFACAGMLEEVVQLFRPTAEAKQLSLMLVKSAEFPQLVRADGEKIRRVLTNLLGNAVKFTRTGGIEVTATTVSVEDGQTMHLRVAVQDTGPGFAPEEIERLFRKFEQTNAGRATQTGTGLGLAISQQYARLLGGQVTVQSQVGQGSTFVLEVPIAPVFDLDHIPRKPQDSALRLAPGQPVCRVLVVDDLEDNRNFLLEIFKLSGFACRPAASGTEALAVAAAWHPHLVLMDTRMPEMDGLETIRRLRAGPESANMKIISLTAMAYAEDREAALIAGADDFAAKPVQIPELLRKIGQLLKLAYVPLAPDPAPAVPAPSAQRAELVRALARQPASWRDQLRDDLLLANFNQVEAAINKIAPQAPGLAKALRKLTGQFDAETILKLLAEAATR